MSLDMEPVYYHVRCDETTDYNQYGIGVTNTKYFMSYQGAKNLNELYFRGRLKGTKNGISVYTGWTELRVNY